MKAPAERATAYTITVIIVAVIVFIVIGLVAGIFIGAGALAIM